MRSRRALALAFAALAAAGCGAGDDEGTTGAAGTTTAPTATAPTAPTATEPGPGLAQTCTNEPGDFTVGYPEGWFTNEGDGVAACTFFHPEPFELPEASEALDVAVRVDREPVPFDRVTGESPAEEVTGRERLQVAGRPAVRTQFVATGEALLPEGTRGTRYAVDLDGETLVATTYDLPGLDYDRNVQVLAEMVESLRIG